MRWVFRAVLVLLVLFAAGVAAAWILLPPVNVPLAGMLAAQFPNWFGAPRAERGVLAERIRLPAGFSIGVYGNVEDARMLRFTATGDLLVASPGAGRIHLLERDRDGNGAADGARVLMDRLDGPNGLDFAGGHLYVAEQGRVGRVRFDDVTGSLAGEYETVIDDLPRGGNHWKKTIRFGPDGRLYLAIGSTCNVCVEDDPRRATMMVFAPDGSGGEVYASGLRNSAGFDWRPSDGALFATDNGRDLLGDDFPPCELNRIVAGGFYGWPFANGDNIVDPDLGDGRAKEIAQALPPVHGFRAHNAPLGIVFPRQGRLPPAYRDAAIVALHGSWNRSTKDGYKVVSLHFLEGGRVEERDFVTGFVDRGNVIGRPAEVTEGPDGAIYVADDYAGAVYRVAFGGAAPNESAAAAVPAPAPFAVQPRDATLIARGQALFPPCLECHAAIVPAAPEATTRVVLAGLGARFGLASLADYLAHPRPPMPPVADAADREALAHYLLEHHP